MQLLLLYPDIQATIICNTATMQRISPIQALVIVVIATAHTANAWCDRSTYAKYSVTSPLLFTCDNSEVKREIASLKEDIVQACSNQTLCEDLVMIPDQLPNFNISELLNEISSLRMILNQLLNQNFNIVKEISALREEVKMLIPLGSMTNPASSCSDILAQNNTASSGYYWLSVNNIATNVLCNFDVQLPPSDPTRGWVQIANIDLNDPSQSCPGSLREISSPSRRCGKVLPTGECESVFFPTSGVPFTKLCGRVLGYATSSVDALTGYACPDPCGIDDPYVDGVSITYGGYPNRQHIWTLVAATQSNCNCGSASLDDFPSFVGHDSYCEGGNSNQPLWDGQGCTDVACCQNPNLPWFCREFNEAVTTDNIEVRLCVDEERPNEDIEFDSIELYIQ